MNITKANLLKELETPKFREDIVDVFLPKGTTQRHELRFTETMSKLIAKGLVNSIDVQKVVTEHEIDPKTGKVTERRIKRTYKKYMVQATWENLTLPAAIGN